MLELEDKSFYIAVCLMAYCIDDFALYARVYRCYMYSDIVLTENS